MNVDQRTSEPRSGTRGLSVVGVLFALLGSASLGVALAAWMLPTLVLPVTGYPGVDRIVALGAFMDEDASRGADAVFLGSSIIVEGIDASIVSHTWGPERRVYNFAVNGCGIGEISVLIHKLARQEPAIVAITLSPVSLRSPSDLEPDKAYAYAIGGFSASMPPEVSGDARAWMSAATERALASDPRRAQQHFRTGLVNRFNNEARLALRRGMRSTDPSDWAAPYELEFSISGERLERHLNEIARMWRVHDLPALDGVALIESVIDDLRKAGCVPLLIAAPVHPRIRSTNEADVDLLLGVMAEMCRDGVCIAIDATDWLGDDGFADAIHPNNAGRRMFSERIGMEFHRIR